MKTKIAPTLFVLAGLTFLFSAGASAQPPQSQPPSAQQQQMDVDNVTLQQFAAAMNEVAAIQQEYSQLLSETQDPAEAQNIQQEAQTKMVEAVLDSGLDVETYNTIAQQAASDPELQGRIEELL